MFETKTMTVTLTTTENQKNMNSENVNTTTINLGNCEDLLRKAYNISDTEKLYMKKIDVVQEGLNIPYIKYDVYSKLNGNTLVKLNLTVCKNSKVDLTIPIIISESLDKLNANSDYYNDICYISSSDSGTDITLKDRKEEFIKGNKIICQDGCDFSNYDYENKKAQCSCDVKESSDNYADMTIDKKKLFKNFIDIKNVANINLLKCYKSLFSKKGFESNIGSFTIIPIFVIHIICIFIFYYNQIDKIKDKINDIMIWINELKLYKNRKKEKRRVEKLAIKKNIPTLDLNNKRIQKIKKRKKTKLGFYKKNNYKNSNNLDTSDKKNKIRNINVNIENMNNILAEGSKNKIILINNENISRKTNEIMKYNEQELNELNYKLALKKDKRSYCEYYFSLIRTKHELIFTFCYKHDYNSKVIKIDLFLINFIINFAINALFFNDDTMHKIYEEKGKFQFLYQLPQMIYSAIISQILNYLLQLLALSEDLILIFKHNKKKLINLLNLKFIIYFILSTIFLLIFWYYLSMFCAIYKNTQIHLIKDTLISFGLSFVDPFVIYLLPGMLRIPALSMKNGECLYKFSQIVQNIL